MIKKSEVLKSKSYKPTFLLAWSKFLTYEELDKTDNLEVYDKEVGMMNVKNEKDWDKTVIEYSEENIKKALCVALDVAIKDIVLNNGLCHNVYFEDIKEWLKILENNDIPTPKKHGMQEILEYYNNVSNFYKFNL